MRILVTGGTGFIGGHLMPAFSPQHQVTLLIHNRAKPLPKAKNQYDIVYADLRDFRQTVTAVCQARPEKVIHLAAVGATDPFLPAKMAIHHNINGTVNLLRACFEEWGECRHFLIARTPGELSNMNTYAASKAAAWTFCQMYARTQGWHINGAMIFQAYGVGQSAKTLIAAALAAARAGRDFPMTSGGQLRDWIHVRDVVAGLLAGVACETLNAGISFDLGTGKQTSVADVVRQIYAMVDGTGKPLIGSLPNRPGETESQVADVVKTKQLLNWQAQTTLKQGLLQR